MITKILGLTFALLFGATLTGPVHAAPSRDLYMVRHLKKMDGFYIGEFAVVRKNGSSVRGAAGAFASEYSCLSGRVTDGVFRGVVKSLEVNATRSFHRKWLGTGNGQHFKGYRSVTRRQLTEYSDGMNPDRPLTYCLRHG